MCVCVCVSVYVSQLEGEIAAGLRAQAALKAQIETRARQEETRLVSAAMTHAHSLVLFQRA